MNEEENRTKTYQEEKEEPVKEIKKKVDENHRVTVKSQALKDESALRKQK